MLVQVKATVEGVGEAEELADIGRAVIGAMMEDLERGHPRCVAAGACPED